MSSRVGGARERGLSSVGGAYQIEDCRWVEGEHMADSELERSKAPGIEFVEDPIEFLSHNWPVEVVGLGFDIEGIEGLVWERLPNSASVDSQQFHVTGDDLHSVLAAVRRRYPDGAAVRGAVLWHSHYTRVRPSKLDIKAFPAWLATVGIVYHSPTGQSSAYDGSGFISSTTESALISLTTDDSI